MLAKTENKKNPTKNINDSPILDLNNSAIKSLIKKGKSNGFVTLDELNSALPPGEYSSEQIEDIHSAINDMGLNIVEQHEETSPEESDEKNSGNLSDEEGARSDDPVRMYLKEMGSVELLSREGEISIAKRIEAGRELMVGGIYESPLAMRAFLKWRDEVDDGSMLLRDIIDLETTYARINGGANEPVVSNDNIKNAKSNDISTEFKIHSLDINNTSNDVIKKNEEKDKIKDTALVRIEQLYSFPYDDLESILSSYPNLNKFIWCQEEPANQGAWFSHRHKLQCFHLHIIEEIVPI